MVDATAMSMFKGSEYIKNMEEKYRDTYVRTYPFLKSSFHQCIAFKDKAAQLKHLATVHKSSPKGSFFCTICSVSLRSGT